MAAAHEIPSLDGLMDSILDRLPPEAVDVLAAMRPRPTGRPDAFADQLVKLVQARARARVGLVEIEPLSDEPDFNEETRRAIRDVDAGEGVSAYDSAADMFADWGV
ncbi:hypothetical protein [Paludisphaera sp.]|uniref:hypothetical protein n=1 Tax=Paludisphaera sp. TaxID=2017432 RepID=UPI00301C3BF0